MRANKRERWEFSIADHASTMIVTRPGQSRARTGSRTATSPTIGSPSRSKRPHAASSPDRSATGCLPALASMWLTPRSSRTSQTSSSTEARGPGRVPSRRARGGGCARRRDQSARARAGEPDATRARGRGTADHRQPGDRAVAARVAAGLAGAGAGTARAARQGDQLRQPEGRRREDDHDPQPRRRLRRVGPRRALHRPRPAGQSDDEPGDRPRQGRDVDVRRARPSHRRFAR